VTAPIPGSLLGSYIADGLGGYKGKYQIQALLMCCGFAFLAASSGFTLFFLDELIAFSIGLWALLLFGSAIVPTCFGVIISSARREQQSASSAFG